LKKLLVVLVYLPFVTGCAGTNAPLNDACSWVKPITWSYDDTDETQRQIFNHNMKYEAFCEFDKGHNKADSS